MGKWCKKFWLSDLLSDITWYNHEDIPHFYFQMNVYIASCRYRIFDAWCRSLDFCWILKSGIISGFTPPFFFKRSNNLFLWLLHFCVIQFHEHDLILANAYFYFMCKFARNFQYYNIIALRIEFVYLVRSVIIQLWKFKV